MKPAYLSFVWHQHQPFYKDVLRERYVLPWVRLHAIKSYTGLLLVLKEFPDIRANVNLVPSLIVQIEEYAAGRAVDFALRITRRCAADLGESDRLFMLDHFFAGNPAQTVDPFPRYRELHDRRAAKSRTAAEVQAQFSAQDILDLQVWATLAWFHPLVVERDPVLTELRRKGRDFTEEDKAAMLERQDAVIRGLLPLHRELAESGQIELSTTPFYHPILPLLCQMESAREAMPGLPMPERRADTRADAEEQVRRALALHERLLGAAPTGMWPAEGSVSMEILPLLRDRGLRWIATDEQILARSMKVNLSRDQSGCLLAPDDLYQPYALPGEGNLPAIIFRDRALSDAIGFEYHHGDSALGAENLVWRVLESARRCTEEAPLIPVILDGENPWDYYPEAGVPFLRALFGKLTREKGIVSTTLSDYLHERPPRRKLERLAAGSWINANFDIWIGKEEDRAAWSLVAAAREALVRREKENPPLDPDAARLAWEELYVAEGSDWYWWLGGDRTSEQDYLFDELFRNHLANLYRLIGAPTPPELALPLGKPPKAPNGTPEGGLARRLEEMADICRKWRFIARHEVATDNAAMRRTSPVAQGLVYGFGEGSFFLRLTVEKPALQALGAEARLAVRISSPRAQALLSAPLGGATPVLRLDSGDGAPPREVGALSIGDAIGLECPTHLLASQPGDQIEFRVELLRGEELIQRVPDQGAIRVNVPAM